MVAAIRGIPTVFTVQPATKEHDTVPSRSTHSAMLEHQPRPWSAFADVKGCHANGSSEHLQESPSAKCPQSLASRPTSWASDMFFDCQEDWDETLASSTTIATAAYSGLANQDSYSSSDSYSRTSSSDAVVTCGLPHTEGSCSWDGSKTTHHNQAPSGCPCLQEASSEEHLAPGSTKLSHAVTTQQLAPPSADLVETGDTAHNASMLISSAEEQHHEAPSGLPQPLATIVNEHIQVWWCSLHHLLFACKMSLQLLRCDGLTESAHHMPTAVTCIKGCILHTAMQHVESNSSSLSAS